MAVTPVSLSYTPAQGITYSVVTDSSADWSSVSNDVRFFDKGSKTVYYKDTTGTIQSPFRQFPAVQTVASAATVTPTSLNDEVVISALAEGVTIANPTGTFVQGQTFLLTIKDNGTSRSIAWGNKYVAYGDALVVATTISKRFVIPVVYDSIGDTFMVLQAQEQQ